MLSSALGRNGVVTLPTEVRATLGLKLGDKLAFDIHDHKVVLSKIDDRENDDQLYYKALSNTLNEWESEEDDQAYVNL